MGTSVIVVLLKVLAPDVNVKDEDTQGLSFRCNTLSFVMLAVLASNKVTQCM